MARRVLHGIEPVNMCTAVESESVYALLSYFVNIYSCYISLVSCGGSGRSFSEWHTSMGDVRGRGVRSTTSAARAGREALACDAHPRKSRLAPLALRPCAFTGSGGGEQAPGRTRNRYEKKRSRMIHVPFHDSLNRKC